MPSLRTIAARYAAFAVAATAANLAAQEAIMRLYSGFGQITASVLFGTAVGFGVKYILDKWFIFFDRSASTAREVRQVALYGVTAVATTAIFWAFEFFFWAAWLTPTAKYTGAAIGLAIGYSTKYALDRQFVFVRGGY